MKKRQKEAVLLDADGVLLDSFSHSWQFYPLVARMLGRSKRITKTRFRRYWGLRWLDFLEKLWPGINPVKFDELYEAKGFDRAIIPLVDGANSVLQWLSKQGYFLGLISSREKDSLLDCLIKAELDLDVFGIVQAIDDAPFHKPDPRVFEPVLRRMRQEGIDADDGLYVGDALTDFQAAKGAGLQFIGVLTGAATIKDFLKAGVPAAHIIDSIRDLPKWLQQKQKWAE